MEEFRQIIGTPNLRAALAKIGIQVAKMSDLNRKQQKAVTNYKHCANDQWRFVNSWYDSRDEDARAYILDPRNLFDTIYSEALENIYGEGFCRFGAGASAYLKDIRFCGKQFLQTLSLYYTAKLMEEAFPEVEGTEEDAEKAAGVLREITKEVWG